MYVVTPDLDAFVELESATTTTSTAEERGMCAKLLQLCNEHPSCRRRVSEMVQIAAIRWNDIELWLRAAKLRIDEGTGLDGIVEGLGAFGFKAIEKL